MILNAAGGGRSVDPAADSDDPAADSDDPAADSVDPAADSDDPAADSVDVVDYEDAAVDIFGELTSGDLTLRRDKYSDEARSLGLTPSSIDEITEMEYDELKGRCASLLEGLGIDMGRENATYPGGQPQRAVFCTRTLNLRSIQAIGLDMDYTLVDYDVDAWEGRAYDFALRSLARRGVPTQGLEIDKDLVIRGLIIDKRHGNIVKTDRFGFVKRAMHGTARMTAAEVRMRYGRELVNLKDERWVFLNTFFSVSEAVLYAQLVDRLDSGAIERTVCPQSYEGLYVLVKEAVFDAHVEGTLKKEIMANPSRFVRPDPELPQTLIDQRQAGKTLMLITNSDFGYTETVMTCALGDRWKEFFDIVIVNARKPDFWSSDAQLYEIVSNDGLMRPVQKLTRQASEASEGKVFSGGSAKQVQAALGVDGSSILYVGDHIYTDAALAKLQFSWRTCLILRELEAEVEALASGRAHRRYLKSLLDKKERVGFCLNQIRLERQRILARPDGELTEADTDRVENFNRVLAELLAVMSKLDDQIGPGIERDGRDFNYLWGHLLRAGVNDRSMLLKQIEKYADVYTSKVSNLGLYSPYMYWRSPPVSMGHDRPKKDDTVLRKKDVMG